MSRDTSATARAARIRQKIQGQESDGGVQTNTDCSHWLQKRLGRTIFFNQTLNGVSTDVPCACYTTFTGDIVMSGTFTDEATFNNSDGSSGITLTATGFADAFVVKYNSAGFVKWATQIGSTNQDIGNGIVIDNANNVVMTGSFKGTATFYNPGGVSSEITLTATGVSDDAYIVKYNSSGFVQWATKIGSSSNDGGNGIAIDNANNIVATGVFRDIATFYNSDGSSGASLTATGVSDDAYIVKYNSSGFVQWATKIGSTNQDIGRGITIDNANNIVATGVFRDIATFYNSDETSGASLTTTGFSDAYVVKYNSSGFVQWATKIGSSSNDGGNGIAIDNANNIVATGVFRDIATFYNSDGSSGASLTATGGEDAYVVKYNSSGFVQWATKIGSTSDDGGRGITIDNANNIAVTGIFTDEATFYNSDESSGITLTATGSYDAYVVKYNSSGFVQWATKIGSSNNEGGNGIAIDNANNIVATGYFEGEATFYNSDGSSEVSLTATGDYDRFGVKYDSSGFVQWAVVAGQTAGYYVGNSIAVR